MTIKDCFLRSDRTASGDFHLVVQGLNIHTFVKLPKIPKFSMEQLQFRSFGWLLQLTQSEQDAVCHEVTAAIS
ncbi:hypothetical protein Tcan_04901 [Toxocara canis]|uniref:Uncharacterized protein n=1 Tax=Toxocara canis TaxID=6265 RepID=A0A0B2VNQ1_TOXCA|nr:hypothetical protein Tcan_04901 [Toxocara canis]